MTPAMSSADGGAAGRPLAGDQALRSRLEEILGTTVEVLPEIGSTNQELATRAGHAAAQHHPLPDLSLLVTDYQSAGKGRLERTWVVAPGEALTFSLLLHPTSGGEHGGAGQPLPTQTYGWLTMLMAAAVTRTLRDQGVAAEIKWPNDVLVAGRKIVGILATVVSFDELPPAVVVGTGINVSTTQFPVQTATSLEREGARVDRGDLLVAVLEQFLPLYRRFCADPAQLSTPHGALRQEVQEHLATLGSPVRAELPGGRPTLVGTAVGLDPHGALEIRDHDGRLHTVNAGDVVHLRPALETGEGPGHREGTRR